MKTNRILPFPVLALVFLASCATTNTIPSHPNQINTFDGAMYDSLMTVQGALNQAKVEIAKASNQQYKAQLNQAIGAYNTAIAAYKLYHTAGQNVADAALQQQITDLVGQVGKLLTTLGVTLK